YELGLKAHPGSADLNAKAGAAALHVGDFASAVDAYVVLGARDGSRAGEAADGLERVARAALAANDRGDAAKGLAGLRAVAPTRPPGLPPAPMVGRALVWIPLMRPVWLTSVAYK